MSLPGAVAVVNLPFSTGDWVAICALGLAALGQTVREFRHSSATRSANSVRDAMVQRSIEALEAQTKMLVDHLDKLESKQQAHDLECAGIRATTASTLAETVRSLGDHARLISQVQAQVRALATHSNDQIMVLGADKKP